MHNRYPQRKPVNQLEETICEGLKDGSIEVLLNRRNPLPDFIQNNLEGTVKILEKQLLGLMDYTYGLDGSIPQRRW